MMFFRLIKGVGPKKNFSPREKLNIRPLDLAHRRSTTELQRQGSHSLTTMTRLEI